MYAFLMHPCIFTPFPISLTLFSNASVCASEMSSLSASVPMRLACSFRWRPRAAVVCWMRSWGEVTL